MIKNEIIKITESPRDAQQGLPYVIDPEKRAAYINALMKVGFDVIDFGSFVSPKAVPQMADQDKVLALVDKSESKSKLMAIVGNLRGGIEAASHQKLDIIGFPYSISETFLRKNINSDHQKALTTIDNLLKICRDNGKTLRIFMSMAYGNPYNDPWSTTLLSKHIELLAARGISTITLADTIGVATAEMIGEIYTSLTAQFPENEFGLHIHTRPDEWRPKLDAAWNSGCRWYEGVLDGIGGCPMTGYELIGNLNTLHLIDFLNEKQALYSLSREDLQKAIETGY
ncbi:MAG: hydroxymethylglutaryl-CoA lyase [Bacteroidetes bacterium HGW-Bacteroidetes-11]|jgi:hydroxymethylglutaryl-CoA lyase|nr:MAG: hydroxymethylglutaryl-CoA lyase [Bacteroidetes bacterium HGW-Bacteroidetes-11]